MSGRVLAAVGLGAALGSVARYVVSLAALHLLGPALPWGTLAANGLGSFVIGLFAALTEPGARVKVSPEVRHFVLAGFCGGFTTFSIFSLETLLLLEARRFGLAAAYVALSLALWLAAVWIGYAAGERANRLRP
ncbi:MAG TPA: fluoride efflux transporter CrcB [Beijerinckiaceae bacterium]|nr:fluoride efflux transporter CrcB [Beijerinckiaceae bacterium]